MFSFTKQFSKCMCFTGHVIKCHQKAPNILIQKKLFMNSAFIFQSSPSLFSADDLSIMDKEKEMFNVKRKIGLYFSQGKYEEALIESELLEKQVSETFGTKNNPIYASCLNNIALMNKMLGRNEVAMDMYIKALHHYEDCDLNATDEEKDSNNDAISDNNNLDIDEEINRNRAVRSGKMHISYANTLMNLGLLYKSMAVNAEMQAKNEQKVLSNKQTIDIEQLIERSEEALEDAYTIHQQLNKKNTNNKISRDSINSSNGLASIKLLKGNVAEAEKLYRECLKLCQVHFGDNDTLTATTMNNLAILLKQKAYKLYVATHAPIPVPKPKSKPLKPVIEDVFDPTIDGNVTQFDDETVTVEETTSVIIPKCDTISEAIKLYEHAIRIRSDTLGAAHPETITAIYNYMELLLCVGEDEMAYKLQQEIIELLGGEDEVDNLLK